MTRPRTGSTLARISHTPDGFRGQLRAIRVISRNSSLQLKSTAWDLKTIARELQVQYVLEGTVRTAGDNLRVTAQLVDVANGQNLWADKYSGRLEDIFDIQERISRQIVEALAMKLSPREDRRLAERQITNVRAYECYQRARLDIYTFTEAGLDRALRQIQDALSLVGDNELLYAALGTVYWQYVNAAIRPDDRFLDMAEDCVGRIFRLNPESVHGFLLRGLVQLARGRPFDALKDLKRVVAIEPNNVQALSELGRIYLVAGQEREGRSTLDRSLAIDPLSPLNQYMLFATEFFYGSPERARSLVERLLEAAPDFAIMRFCYAISLVQAGRPDDARQLLAEAPEEPVPSIAGGCCRFLMHALEGRRAEALAAVSDDLKSGARRVEWWSFYMAECYAFLEDADEALNWLDNAARLGFTPYPFLAGRETTLAKFRGQPRYDALMLKVKDAWEHFPR